MKAKRKFFFFESLKVRLSSSPQIAFCHLCEKLIIFCDFFFLGGTQLFFGLNKFAKIQDWFIFQRKAVN